ncbi:MAG: (d)CMP kinase, partial [Flavobacteriales bacterium]|nr:(d)CMP kinase [Flavobacteriales bacterium]
TTFDEVLRNVNSRDSVDSSRTNDPLRQAADAIIIDNTNLTPEEQFDHAMLTIRAAIAVAEKKTEVGSEVVE